jgi:hypothetical protein
MEAAPSASDAADWYEELREQYRPERLRVLLVAESPPDPGEGERRFFYAPELRVDNLYRGVAQALYGEHDEMDILDKPAVLDRIRADGYWLVDAVDEPINKLGSAARARAIAAGVPRLAERCVELAPELGVMRSQRKCEKRRARLRCPIPRQNRWMMEKSAMPTSSSAQDLTETSRCECQSDNPTIPNRRSRPRHPSAGPPPTPTPPRCAAIPVSHLHGAALAFGVRQVGAGGRRICHGKVYAAAAQPLREAGVVLLHDEPLPFPLGNWRAAFTSGFRQAVDHALES